MYLKSNWRDRYAVIAGEAFKDARHVVFRIYEDAATTALAAEQTDRRKRADPKAYAFFRTGLSSLTNLLNTLPTVLIFLI